MVLSHDFISIINFSNLSLLHFLDIDSKLAKITWIDGNNYLLYDSQLCLLKCSQLAKIHENELPIIHAKLITGKYILLSESAVSIIDEKTLEVH